MGKLIGSKIPKIHLFSLISIKIPEVANQRGCHGLRGCGCQYGSSFSLSNVLFLSYTFQKFHFRRYYDAPFFIPRHFSLRKRSIRLWRKTSVLRQPIDASHVDNIKFPPKILSKHTENRERRKNSDKSSPPQPSLFHLCLPNPPPHHTPELTAT